MSEKETKTYNKGDDVPEDSHYVCVPCGYHHYYKAGDKFGECISCLAGTQDGPEEYAEGLELWEKLEEKKSN
jgi:hypothetical protein